MQSIDGLMRCVGVFAVGWPIFGALPIASAQSPTAVYDYDALGRLNRVDYATGDGIDYTYDAAGNRTQVQTQPANLPPVAVSDTYTLQPGISVNRNVLGNDTDPESQALSLASETGSFTSISASGTKVLINAPLPAGAYQFEYIASDGVHTSNAATVTINVQNMAPTLVNDTYSVSGGVTVDKNVLANDSDPNGDTLSLVSENSSHASIVANELRFSAPQSSGTHNVNYTVSDGNGKSSVATATFVVTAASGPVVRSWIGNPVAPYDESVVTWGGVTYRVLWTPDGSTVVHTWASNQSCTTGGLAPGFQFTGNFCQIREE